MFVPPTSGDLPSSDIGVVAVASEEEIMGGDATTDAGTDIIGIVCTFFATSLFTFWF
jgi:hypothetical protein